PLAVVVEGRVPEQRRELGDLDVGADLRAEPQTPTTELVVFGSDGSRRAQRCGEALSRGQRAASKAARRHLERRVVTAEDPRDVQRERSGCELIPESGQHLAAEDRGALESGLIEAGEATAGDRALAGDA